ncbi:hypothetical protein KPH14_008138 [Odynerus spinipes]|uniref:Uncharacterized protein n=1 Tax=Odynerus spinipes TaxID=1348599 RepID=A0AAD9RA51_9HYME|nr:hypothetical protein KPH14_008138 [Odynerus spinipes]
MAMLYKNEKDVSIAESLQYHCKCTKSESRMDRETKPYLKEMAASIEERHCDLTGRHRYLREKITTMERSIPALMAYNMWIAGKKCEDAPYCKIRDIMSRLSPDLDPTEKLLRNLKNAVKDLNKETTELHDKIIDADIKLEEADIELESVELANKEMDNHANDIENELRSYRGSSLHSIHSEDLICLTKIHELAKEELDLKNCITELEMKEALYAEQLDRLLASKEFQSISGNKGMLKRIQDLECNEKRMHCALQFYKNNIQQLKKELTRKRSDGPVNVTSPPTISNRIMREKSSKAENIKEKDSLPYKVSKNQRTEFSNEHKIVRKKGEKSVLKEKNGESCICSSKTKHESASLTKKSAKSSKKAQVLSPNECPLKSNYVPSSVPDTKIEKNKCKMACTSVLLHSKYSNGSTELKNPCSVNLPCDLPPHRIKSNCPTAPSNFSATSCNFCAPSTSCKKCHLPRNTNECVCNCKGKCAFGLSSAPCQCGVIPSCPLDKGYQPVARSSCLRESSSDSDEEYCECCSCGCEDTDENDSSCCCN